MMKKTIFTTTLTLFLFLPFFAFSQNLSYKMELNEIEEKGSIYENRTAPINYASSNDEHYIGDNIHFTQLSLSGVPTTGTSSETVTIPKCGGLYKNGYYQRYLSSSGYFVNAGGEYATEKIIFSREHTYTYLRQTHSLNIDYRVNSENHSFSVIYTYEDKAIGRSYDGCVYIEEPDQDAGDGSFFKNYQDDDEFGNGEFTYVFNFEIKVKKLKPKNDVEVCYGETIDLRELITTDGSSSHNGELFRFSCSSCPSGSVSGEGFTGQENSEVSGQVNIVRAIYLHNSAVTIDIPITVKPVPTASTVYSELGVATDGGACHNEGILFSNSSNYVFRYTPTSGVTKEVNNETMITELKTIGTSSGKTIKEIEARYNTTECTTNFQKYRIFANPKPDFSITPISKTKGEALSLSELYNTATYSAGGVFSVNPSLSTVKNETFTVKVSKNQGTKTCELEKEVMLTVKVPSYTPPSLDIWYQDPSFVIDGKMNNHHASATYSADIGSISSGVYTPSQVGDDTIRTTIFGYEYKLPVKVKTPRWINTEIEKYAGQSSGTLEDNVDDFHSDLLFSFGGVSAVKTTVLSHEKETPGKSYTASFRGYGLGNFTIKTITPKWKTTTRKEWKGETITLCDLMSDIPDCSDISFSSDKGSISTTKILTVDYSGIATVTAIIYGESYTIEIESKEHSFMDLDKDGYVGQSSFDIEDIVENYHPTSIITVNGTESTNGKFSYITAGINTIQITATGQDPISKEIEVLEPIWISDDLSSFTGTSALDLYKKMTDVPARTDVVFTVDIGTISNGFYLYDEVGTITITAEVYGHTYEKTLEVFTHSFMDVNKDGYIGQSSFDIEDIVENYHPTSTILIDGVETKDGKFKYEVEGIKRVVVLADAQEVITRTIDVVLPKWETEEKLYFKGETVDLYALMEDAPDLSEVVFTTNKGRIHSNKDLIMEFSEIATVTAIIYGESYTTEIESKEHSFMDVNKDGYVGQSSFDVSTIVDNYHSRSEIYVNGLENNEGVFVYDKTGENVISISAPGQNIIDKTFFVYELSWEENTNISNFRTAFYVDLFEFLEIPINENFVLFENNFKIMSALGNITGNRFYTYENSGVDSVWIEYNGHVSSKSIIKPIVSAPNWKEKTIQLILGQEIHLPDHIQDHETGISFIGKDIDGENFRPENVGSYTIQCQYANTFFSVLIEVVSSDIFTPPLLICKGENIDIHTLINVPDNIEGDYILSATGEGVTDNIIRYSDIPGETTKITYALEYKTKEGGTVIDEKTFVLKKDLTTLDFIFSPENPKYGEETRFYASNKDLYTYKWIVSPNQKEETEDAKRFWSLEGEDTFDWIYDVVGEHTATLTGTTQDGCIIEVQKPIKIEEDKSYDLYDDFSSSSTVSFEGKVLVYNAGSDWKRVIQVKVYDLLSGLEVEAKNFLFVSNFRYQIESKGTLLITVNDLYNRWQEKVYISY